MRTMNTCLSLVKVRKRRIMRSRWFFMLSACCIVALSSLVWVSPTRAGRIVAANDDWIFWDPQGFDPSRGCDGAQFAQNVARWFVGEMSGSFLVYSDHPGLISDPLRNAMESAGHSWNVDAFVDFTLATLQAYDGVFVGNIGADCAVLVNYIKAGGNVYVMGGDPSYVDMWNPFLQEFGLEFIPYELNAFFGPVYIDDEHPLFDGVDLLYHARGNRLRVLDESDPRTQLLVYVERQNSYGWLFGIYEHQDNQGPVTSSVIANPNVAMIGGSVNLTANVDDTTEGGSTIASAEYNLDGGTWTSMAAQDGTFDEISEDVTVGFTASSAVGVYNLCVRGTDAVGNVGNQECIMLVVYDPSAGFVTGGGWIDSPAGAYVPDPSLTGKANFGFVSKYKKGAEVPTGQTEFKFEVADMDFHSSSYDWLVVTGSDYARFKGWGSINGEDDYRFMLWAGDDPDTFRIKIWEEDESGVETVKYDNGFNQAIAGGSIVIHVK